MDPQAYQQWQSLHSRVVQGDCLSDPERATYEAGCRELDAAEGLDGDLSRLKELRARIREAETEQQRLRDLEADLDARIASLEARLDRRTRQLLGISD